MQHGLWVSILAGVLFLVSCQSPSAETSRPTALAGGLSGPYFTSESNDAILREAIGKFQYRKLSTGQITGEEEFALTTHEDGTRTVHARNRSENFNMQRHVAHRVDENFRPLETTAVYYILGEWRGTGWFAVTGNELRAIVKSPEGITEQAIEVPDRFSFVPHPLSTNAWHGASYDREKGGVQTITWYNLEAGAQGASSMLGELSEHELELIGQKELTTPAGTFLVDHWRTGTVDYYTTGPDMMMVQFDWADKDNQYILTELIVRD